MKCPNCGAEMRESVALIYMSERDLDSFRCDKCGVCGPRNASESLSRRLSPEGVMDEAERLLREAGITGDVPAHALVHNYTVNHPERPDSSGGC